MQSSFAHHFPHYTAQALRARGKRSAVLPQAFGLLAIVAGLTWCATSTASAAAESTAPTPMHSPAHRRLRQALGRQRCTARPLFTRPAWPRPQRSLLSHNYQRAPCKLSLPPTIQPRRYAPAASVQSPYLTLSDSQLLSQGGPVARLARHQRRRQALRRKRCTARRIGGCDKHCEYNDAQPGRFSHGRRGRDVRYDRTIINAHHVS
jgi:hypothetical protein